MKTRFLTTALICSLLAGCSGTQDQEPEKYPLADEVKAVTGGYINLHAESTLQEIIEDTMQTYFLDSDIAGTWMPDPDLNNRPGIKELYSSIAASCAFQVQLPLKNGYYQIARAYNINAEFSKFFEGFTVCVKNTLPYTPVPTEWLSEFSQFHNFNKHRTHPDVRAITGEKSGKSTKLMNKPIAKQLDFDELRQIISITQKL